MPKKMTRREWLGAAGSLAGSLAGAGMLARLAQAAETPAAPGGGEAPAKAAGPFRELPPYGFYAFDNGLNGPDVPTVEAKAALLKKLGYAGMTDHYALHRLPEVLAALDKEGLEFASLYVTPNVEDPIDPKLKDAIALLKGRRARIEIGLLSKKVKPAPADAKAMAGKAADAKATEPMHKSSDPAADPQAVEFLKRVADWCGDTGPIVSIYPHAGFWTHRAEDGVRLARQVGSPNVGVNLNLVHWQWATPVRPLDELLAEAMPYLKLVTINGLKGREIVSLADGDFDVTGFLAAVKKAGYKGPVGLQCYSIKGPSEAHLARSMAKWLEIKKQLSL